MLQKLALYMVRANEPTIEYSTLLEKLKGYLAELDESILPAAFLKQIEQVSELLVKRDESYEFAHLSFQGYLAALEIKEQKQEHLLLKHYSEAWWKETILLYAAQVSTPQLSILIRQLCEIGTPEAVASRTSGRGVVRPTARARSSERAPPVRRRQARRGPSRSTQTGPSVPPGAARNPSRDVVSTSSI